MLLIVNLLVRAGWKDDARIVRFMVAIFSAANDPDKVAKTALGSSEDSLPLSARGRNEGGRRGPHSGPRRSRWGG